MPFIPHTEDDLRKMLAAIGVDSIDALFDEIPTDLLIDDLHGVPEGVNEMEITRLMRARAAKDKGAMCFIGAGAYEHHIPAAVWEITTRGEFYSAYTPYQAEASQGTLQTIYEYQSMIAGLTGLAVSNASLYDGASALAEAALMAVRANRRSKSKRVLLSAGVNPTYRDVATTIAGTQGLTFDTLPLDRATGTTDLAALDEEESPVALVVQTPSFFGTLESVDALTEWAHERGALVIALVNPTSLALLKAPGSWGGSGADIACGEGPTAGRSSELRRSLFRFHGLSREARAADAGPYRWSNHRPGRRGGLYAHAPGAGAAHPAIEGYVEHLYEPRADGHGGDDLHGATWSTRSRQRGGRVARQHATTGEQAQRHRGR